ncbi:MarR family transcriptional regulator [Deinococcus cavernae]|uniref:MarR family transcriptional regulator n=2 Tax=Deinococcus TaxID=1298 RepID=A0A418VB66_9DEIO|nr:MarR family transcriptional regulator [Deinococcus cavernae]RJF73289.1 MarR family transcriptional regulator [Deinococcus cavernae]
MPSRYPGTQEEKRALAAYVKLSRAAQAMETAAHRHLAAHNLTISQFGVLEALLHLGPLSQRRLAEKILRSSGNLTMVIDNLERDGLVTRERDPNDRRVMIVTLTATGESLIRNILPTHVEGLTSLFSALEPEEVQELAYLTRKLGLSLK